MEKLTISLEGEQKYIENILEHIDESPVRWKCVENKESLLVTKKGNIYSFYTKEFNILFTFNNINNKINKIDLKHLLQNEAFSRGYYTIFTF